MQAGLQGKLVENFYAVKYSIYWVCPISQNKSIFFK